MIAKRPTEGAGASDSFGPPPAVVVVSDAAGLLHSLPIADGVDVAYNAGPSVIVAGADSHAVAGDDSIAIAGYAENVLPSATVGVNGLAYVLDGNATGVGQNTIAITRGGKHCTAHAANLIAATYQGGFAQVDAAGVAIAVDNPGPLTAIAQAGLYGVIVLGYFDDELQTMRYVAREVDGQNIRADTPYRLNANYVPEAVVIPEIAKP